MVVHDLNVVRVFALPAEANPILIVHSDAVLAGAVAPQWLKPVAGRQLQVAQLLRAIQLRELAERHPLDLRRQAVISAALPQTLSFPTGKADNHRLKISDCDIVSMPARLPQKLSSNW